MFHQQQSINAKGFEKFPDPYQDDFVGVRFLFTTHKIQEGAGFASLRRVKPQRVGGGPGKGGDQAKRSGTQGALTKMGLGFFMEAGVLQGGGEVVFWVLSWLKGGGKVVGVRCWCCGGKEMSRGRGELALASPCSGQEGAKHWSCEVVLQWGHRLFDLFMGQFLGARGHCGCCVAFGSVSVPLGWQVESCFRQLRREKCRFLASTWSDTGNTNTCVVCGTVPS